MSAAQRSPRSSQGTSLALVGAYVLAEELRKAADDYRAAFMRYEERMRPYVILNQGVATGDPSAPGFMDNFERAPDGDLDRRLMNVGPVKVFAAGKLRAMNRAIRARP